MTARLVVVVVVVVVEIVVVIVVVVVVVSSCRRRRVTAADVLVYDMFLPARRYASAGNRHSNVSVCLSRAGIVSKRRTLAA